MCYTDLLAHLSKQNGVQGTGWKCWDMVSAIADSFQHCFQQGQSLLFQKMAKYNVGDSMGSSPEAAPLKGKTVHRSVPIHWFAECLRVFCDSLATNVAN